MKHYLHAAIAEDNTSGAEYFLASIVQDAVIHECFETEDADNLKKMAHRAARLAINSVYESMGINSFIVCETVRGVIHGLVALGGEPVTMTREAIRGFCMESLQYELPVHEVIRGISVGLKMTARDLGVDENELLAIANSEATSAFWDSSKDASEMSGVSEGASRLSGVIMEEDQAESGQYLSQSVETTYDLEEEIELLINKTLTARRKRPYIRYTHGRIRHEK